MKKKYIVTLTYETKVIVLYNEGSGSEWEHEVALEAEQFRDGIEERLADWTVERARDSDKREPDNA